MASLQERPGKINMDSGTSVAAEEGDGAPVPAGAPGIVCHFLHEIHCEYCLKQLGSSDPYRPEHNSVYMTRRKCGHGATLGSVCVFSCACARPRFMVIGFFLRL